MTAGTEPPGISCPACGRLASPQDNFCEACRTELAPAVVSAGLPGPGPACPFCPQTKVSPDGYCESCGRKVPSARDHTELDLGLLAGVTDRGLRHHRNEDAMALAIAELDGGPAAVAVVCDGISSSARPDEASLAAAQAAADVLLAAVRTGADLAGASVQAVRSAQQAVTELAAPPADAPAATFISAVLTADAVTVCWLGDSRAYWLDSGAGHQPRRLTTDDSLAEEMIAAGVLTEADASASPHAHVVTRWLGADLRDAAPHVTTFQPDGPGVLLLCSDGLWNYEPDPAALAGLALPRALTDPLGAAASLVRFALDAGGRDNVTVVLVPSPPAWPSTGRGQDRPTTASA
ncbi:MAG: PP2C family serine/threonine-protein phosphatase [Actinomycetota bacterium]